jgi:hypothetical protein
MFKIQFPVRASFSFFTVAPDRGKVKIWGKITRINDAFKKSKKLPPLENS